jgi:wobble nucleotide-excising tRNase
MTNTSPSLIVDRISVAKKFGMIDEFNWPTALTEFSKVNVIYGRNGSGKTTFSNIFRVTSRDENIAAIRQQLCSHSGFGLTFRIAGKNCSMNALAASHPIFVFNGGFVADHVYEGNKANLKKFTGSAAMGQISNPEIQKLAQEVSSLSLLISAADKDQKELQTRHKKIKDRWSKDFNNNVKGSRLSGVTVPTARPPESLADLKSLLSTLYKQNENIKDPQKVIDQLDFLGKVSIVEISENFVHLIFNLLRKDAPAASGSRIESSVSELPDGSFPHAKSMREWIEDGVFLLNHRHEQGLYSCPLCLSDLKASLTGLLKEYDNYLNDHRSAFRKQMEGMEITVFQTIEGLRNVRDVLSPLNVVLDEYSVANESGGLKAEDINVLIKSLGNIHTSLKQKISDLDKVDWVLIAESEKLKDSISNYSKYAIEVVSRIQAVQLNLESMSQGGSECLSKIRTTINKIVAIEFDDEAAGKQIAALLKTQKTLDDHEQILPEKKAMLSGLLAKLKTEAKSVNKYLKMLGLYHFEIDISESEGQTENILINYTAGDQISSIKNSLSEGEKTCLAFSYFLSKMDNDLFSNAAEMERTIVVIDDPVSSLDEERLHSTAQLIAKKFEPVGQLFILSHSLQYLRFQSAALPQKSAERSDFYLMKKDGTLHVTNLPATLANFATPYFEKLGEIICYSTSIAPGYYEQARKYIPGYVRIVLESFLGFKFCVLKQGASGQKYLTPGLDKLTNRLSGSIGDFKDLKKVGDIDHSSIIPTLEEIKRLTDSQVHGNIQTMDEFVFVSETELKALCRNTVDVIRFFDPFHAREAEILATNCKAV